MTDRMARRGPDAEGTWASAGIVLGHRRLSILDLEARANQPMCSADGRFAAVFNGEIYNFRELRSALEGRGITFRTTSDTEVLLELFAAEGEGMLTRLRGMFALAIWDTCNRELFLARDPYGIKPLYCLPTRSGLLFASQVKALLASGLASTKIEPAGMAGFYLWGSVPEPWTLYRDITALPSGHWLKVRRGVPGASVCWHDIRTHWRAPEQLASPAELQERVKQAVSDSVRAHLVSDVPVSVFLSGGIDSSVVSALAAESGGQIEGITIGLREFSDTSEDEIPAAAAHATQFDISHSIHYVTQAEFEQDIPEILRAMDQPTIDGVNTWFASKAAARRGYKVVLSGVGGDELFCGYSTFRQIPRAAALGRALATIPGFRFMLSGCLGRASAWSSRPKTGALPVFMDSSEGLYFLKRCLFLPEELPALMSPEATQEGLMRLGGSPPGMVVAQARDGVSTVGSLESCHFLRNQLLRDSDWASMAHSLELRTPLVDVALLETLGPFVSGFAGEKGKTLLARSTQRPLPRAVLERSKTGFNLPMSQWLSQATDASAWSGIPMLAKPGTAWARRWARTVISGMEGFE
jgi:asparagine synthase (glutamine-hydrolysing)